MAIGEMTTTAVGNLTGDPEMRFTTSGAGVAEFTIAINPKVKDKDTNKWVDGDPSFLRVQVWRDLAEHVVESLHKGDRAIVTGRLREDRWEKEGQKHSRWTLTADNVGADMTFATVKIAKVARKGDVPPDDPWATGSRSRPNGTNGASESAPLPPEPAYSDDPPF